MSIKLKVLKKSKVKRHVYDISQIDRTPKSQRKESSKCFWRINYIIQILNSNKFVFETKFNTHIHVYLRARDVCVTPHLILFFKNLLNSPSRYIVEANKADILVKIGFWSKEI